MKKTMIYGMILIIYLGNTFALFGTSLSILDTSPLKNVNLNLNITNKEEIFCLQNGNCAINLYGFTIQNHNDSGFNFVLPSAMIYYNNTFDNSSFIGIGFTNLGNGKIRCDIAGWYDVNFAASGSGTTNHNYHSTIAINGIPRPPLIYEGHLRISTATDVGNIAGGGQVYLNENDTITHVFEDSTGTSNVMLYSSYMRFRRVGG